MIEKHGGNLFSAEKKYNIPKSAFIDFSANINPLGVPKTAVNTILSILDNITSYPDPNSIELREAISKYLRVELDSIFVGNGAIEVIDSVLKALNSKKVLMLTPTFSEYKNILDKTSTDIFYCHLNENDNFNIDFENLFKSMESGIDTLVLCNPNNPTSTLISLDCMKEILIHTKKHNVNLVVDEAFIELTIAGNKNSCITYMNAFSNLFVVRAFTKLFAIPGIRLGYGIGNKDLVKTMWDKKLTWSVNTFANQMGICLNDQDYINKTNQWLNKEIDWLFNELSNIPGIKPYKPSSVFILIKILSDNTCSEKLKDILASKRILIRDASNFNSLNNKFVRVAVKDNKNNQLLIKELTEIFSSISTEQN